MTPRDKVLVVGPSWVGDMVMAQSLYKLLRSQSPAAEIHVVAPPWSLPVLERMPEVARGIELAVGHGELGLGRRLALARRLRAERYDRAIVLPRSLKAARCTRMASSATSKRSMPSMLDAVPVKYLSTSDLARPTASNCCEPV